MSRNRRNWSNLSSLARQRTLEDEEEQEREQRRRNRNLSSTTDADISVSVSLAATEQHSAEERVQALKESEFQETLGTQDDDQEFLEMLKKREERRQKRQMEIVQHLKAEQQNEDSEAASEQKDAEEPKSRETKQQHVGELKSGNHKRPAQELKSGTREQRLSEQEQMGEPKPGGREQKPGKQEQVGEPKSAGREQRLNKQEQVEELKSEGRDQRPGTQKHLGEAQRAGEQLAQSNASKKENVPSNARNSEETAVLSSPANERDHGTKKLNKQMSLERATSPLSSLSPTQKYTSQVFVSSVKISRTPDVGKAWKSLDSSSPSADGKSPGVTEGDGQKPSTWETKGRSMQRTTSLKQCLTLQLSPVGEENKEMGTEHQTTPTSAKDGPMDSGLCSPRATTGASPLRRFSPRTSSFRIMIKKEQPEDNFTRSASLRISSKNSKLDERLERYASAVQKSEMMKPPMSTKKDFIPLPAGITSKRSIFEKEANSSGVSSPTSRKETVNTSGRVASRITQWLGKTQEESTETKDVRKGNLSAKHSLWESPGSAVDGKP